MTLLIIGLILWWGAHLLKRLAPGLRASMGDKTGKGVVAVALLLSLVLMVLGYRGADFVNVWFPPMWAWHLNNLLMLIAIALLGMGHSKGRARSWFRHPMLMAVATWGVAHLLVNGDLASVVLFGGLAAWAVAEMLVINATSPAWVRPEPGPAKGDMRLALITIIAFVLIVAVHWGVFGVKPFPG
ncbi:NnrU family protein [Oceanicella sp. SM1341]|uniref:NnrU family protein n=1 Tax=Oceanicella sp. SM1341 TaxID=1548889 RepID=UPI000E4A6DF1|nr:NnrU family protein [Oceanicella sp. SM1341]